MTAKAAASQARAADPCCFVVFGASGDLTRRLLVPALYNLAAAGLLREAFCVVGVGRTQLSTEAFRKHLETGLREFATQAVDSAIAAKLLACVTYLAGEAESSETYKQLGAELARIENARHTAGNRLFYLATPPAAFAPIGTRLGQTGLAREADGAWRRVIFE